MPQFTHDFVPTIIYPTLIEDITSGFASTVPAWITISGSDILVDNADISFLGLKRFQLTTISGTLTSTITFDVTFVCSINSISLDTVPATSFDIAAGSPTIINLPSYYVDPAVCQTQVTIAWSLDNTSFASIVASQIQVSTSILSLIGPNTITLIADAVAVDPTTTQFATSSQATTPVDIAISCYVTSFDPITYTSAVYQIADAQLTLTKPTLVLNPTICAATYSVSLEYTPLDASIFDYTDPLLTAFSTDPSKAGVYTFQWIATSDAGFLDSAGFAVTSTTAFTIEVLYCLEPLSFTLSNIPSLTAYDYLIDPAIINTVQVSIPTYAATYSAGCPVVPLVLSLESIEQIDVAIYSTFISINTMSMQVDVATNNVALNGIYNFNVLATSGSIINSEFQFQVTLICTVLALNPSPVTAQFYQLLSPQAQVSVAFAPDPLGCGVLQLSLDVDNSGTFETTKSFISVQDVSTLVITSTDYALKGQHTVTLKASIPSSTTIVGLDDASSQFTVDLICVINSIITAPISIPSIVYNAPATLVQLTGFSIDPPQCGATFTQTILDMATPAAIPATVTYALNPVGGTNELSLISTSSLDQGTYSLQLSTSINAGPYLDTTNCLVQTAILPFAVVADCSSFSLSSTPTDQVSYLIGSNSIQVPFPTYTGLPTGCNLNLAFEVELESVVPLQGFPSAAANSQAALLPSFLTYDTNAFTVYGSNNAESWSTWKIRVTATDLTTGVTESSYLLEVTTSMDCATGLNYNLPSDFHREIVYTIGSGLQSTQYSDALDSISLMNGIGQICGPVQYAVNKTDETGTIVAQLPSFALFSSGRLEITASNILLEDTYFLLFDIFLANFASDNSFAHRKEIVKLVLTNTSQYSVKNPSVEETTPELVVPETQNSTETTDATNSTALKNATGIPDQVLNTLLRDANDTEAKEAVLQMAKDFAAYPSFIWSLMPTIKPVVGKRARLRFADVEIEEVSEDGSITLAISEPVILINGGSEIDLDLLELSYVKESEEDVQMTTWELKSYESTQIKLQLTFSQPLLVSTGDKHDRIVATLSKLLFIPENKPFTYEPISQLLPLDILFELENDIPRQAKSKQEYLSLVSVQQITKQSTLIAIVIPFIVQIFAKGAMKKLWFYFNTMQLIDSYIKFVNVKPPANVEIVAKAYNDIIHVKLLPDSVMASLKEQFGVASNATNSTETANSTNSSDSHRALLAAPSATSIKRNRIILAGIVGFFIAVILLLLVCRRRIWQHLSSKRKATYRSIHRSFFWLMPIRTGLELFYPMCLAACLDIEATRDFNKNYKSVAIMLVFGGFLLFTCYFMHKHREDVDKRHFKVTFGAYMTNVETYKKPMAVYYPCVFMIRRLFMVVTITFLQRNLVWQVLFAVHGSLIMLTWLINVKPFDAKFKTYLECFNEFILLIMSYIGFLFSDYVDNPISRYSFGYVYIAIIGFGLLVNVITMGTASLVDLVRWCKNRQNKKNAQKQAQMKVGVIAESPVDANPKVVQVNEPSESSESEEEKEEEEEKKESSYIEDSIAPITKQRKPCFGEENDFELQRPTKKLLNADMQEPEVPTLMEQVHIHRKRLGFQDRYFANYDRRLYDAPKSLDKSKEEESATNIDLKGQVRLGRPQNVSLSKDEDLFLPNDLNDLVFPKQQNSPLGLSFIKSPALSPARSPKRSPSKPHDTLRSQSPVKVPDLDDIRRKRRIEKEAAEAKAREKALMDYKMQIWKEFRHHTASELISEAERLDAEIQKAEASIDQLENYDYRS